MPDTVDPKIVQSLAPEHDHPLARAVLAALPGATLTSITDRTTGVIVPIGAAEQKADTPVIIGGMHQINAPMFGALAEGMVKLGWSVFPQNRNDRRGPGKIDRIPLAWKPYKVRLPTLQEIAWWSAFCPSHNIATLLGPASGHTFGIDVDVSDFELSDAIQKLADDILGYTPFRRVGRFPRIVLVYRQAGAATAKADDLIRTKRRHFEAVDGESPGMLEILADGSPVTFFGLHHKTGKYFVWVDKSPHFHGPEIAPLVSREQLDEFILAVHALRAFSLKAEGQALAETWTFDPEAGMQVPTQLGNATEWVEEDGKVVDGREKLLFQIAAATVRANENAARNAGPGRQNICALVERVFNERALLDGNWGSPTFVRSEVAAKVASSITWHIDHNAFARRIRPGRPVAIDAEGRVEHAPAHAEASDPASTAALDALMPKIARQGVLSGRKLRFKLLAHACPVRAQERALIVDEAERTRAAQAACREVERHEYEFIVNRLYPRGAERIRKERAKGKGAEDQAELDPGLIAILKGDAGVGKTRSFWKALSRAKDLLGPLGFPIGFAAPSHANIEDNLASAVKEKKAWERSVRESVAEGQRHGLKVLVFRGKMRTNCAFKAQHAILSAENIGADRLCKARVQVAPAAPGEKPAYEERRCPFWDKCEYQKSLAEIATADVVLFASAYLSVTPPAALSKALIGVFVDERPYGGLLRDNSQELMPLSVLKLPRAAPRLQKAEIADLKAKAGGYLRGVDMDDRKEGFLSDREAAVRMMMPHLEKGDAGAAVQALHDYKFGKDRRGLAYAESAKAVCARTDDAARDVVPGLTEEDATKIATAPRGDSLRMERRFWAIVCERLEAMRDDEDWDLALRMLRQTWTQEEYVDILRRLSGLRDDKPWADAIARWTTTAVEWPSAPKRACGTRDYRLQVMTDGKDPALRMSWRKAASFDGLPLLMLDASASPEIVRKVWKDRVVEVLPVSAPCHMHVVLLEGWGFSDRSMDPGASTRHDDILDTVEKVQKIRDLITRLAGIHGDGRVLICANKGITMILRARWKSPKNVDWVWNGAMRGLDFAKNHVAALCVGRMELPYRAIDAQVAALTYDDEFPEEPVDRYGTGCYKSGDPLRPMRDGRRVMMRTGRDIEIEDTAYEGRWATIVQQQTRDEEVRQFAARLRPVHRLGTPPVVYLACTAVPHGMIVDDVLALDDMLFYGPRRPHQPWEIARAADGLLDETRGWENRPDLGGRPDGTLDPEILSVLKLEKEKHSEARGTVRIRYRIGNEAWRYASIARWDADLLAPLRASVAREFGITAEDFHAEVAVDVLREGREHQPSGIRPPDKIDLLLTGLEEGASREDVRQVYQDQEATDREATMAQERSDLSGLPIDADPAAIDAALRRCRIAAIDWNRLAVPGSVQRKDDTVTLAVRTMAARYGVGAPVVYDDGLDCEEA